jgi:hypothetical protein
MKKNHLLKNLIDVLFILMVPGFLAFFFIIPVGLFNTRIGDISVQNWEDVAALPSLYWAGIICSMITYLCMLVALFYLKKTARYFLDNNLLKAIVSKNLQRSGTFFLATSIGTVASYIFLWFTKFSGNQISFGYTTDIFLPLILAIIGLFFMIISNTIEKARITKEEFDLTV